MKKYTWEEIKNESGVYKTFCEEGYPMLKSQLGLFDFHSKFGEITVLNGDGGEEINDYACWHETIFVKIKG